MHVGLQRAVESQSQEGEASNEASRGPHVHVSVTSVKGHFLDQRAPHVVVHRDGGLQQHEPAMAKKMRSSSGMRPAKLVLRVRCRLWANTALVCRPAAFGLHRSVCSAAARPTVPVQVPVQVPIPMRSSLYGCPQQPAPESCAVAHALSQHRVHREAEGVKVGSVHNAAEPLAVETPVAPTRMDRGGAAGWER